ncbi:MAG: hypothetical protein U0Y10_11635 [Spirosomataceae bacterium]
MGSYIEFFSESDLVVTDQKAGDNPFSIKLFPSYTPTFWISLGTDYTLRTATEAKGVGDSKRVLVLRNNTLERVNSPKDHIFTIKFKPCGFEVIFGVPQSQIGNEFHDAAELLGAGTNKPS